MKIESANGKKTRPLVQVRTRVAGNTLNTRVTVVDRSELPKDVLLAAGTSTGS